MFYEVNFNFLIQEQKKLSLNSCFVEIVLKMLNCGYLAGNPAFDTPIDEKYHNGEPSIFLLPIFLLHKL